MPTIPVGSLPSRRGRFPSFSAVSLAAFLVFLLSSVYADADMLVHFIDVAQGSAVLIQKDDKNVLYNCGDTAASTAILDYLDALEVASLDALIASHAHRDYIGGCIGILQKLHVTRVYHNGSSAATATWRRFLHESRKAEEVVKVISTLRTPLFELLAPYSTTSRPAREADNSLLLRITDRAVTVLLAGGCESVCERALTNYDVKATILNVSHHGSATASSRPFLERVKPKASIISSGLNNQYRHPDRSVVDRLTAVGSTIYRTDLMGSIVFRSNGTTYVVDTER